MKLNGICRVYKYTYTISIQQLSMTVRICFQMQAIKPTLIDFMNPTDSCYTIGGYIGSSQFIDG